jgi:predicted aldo/keto reductase-like oxidoreductase
MKSRKQKKSGISRRGFIQSSLSVAASLGILSKTDLLGKSTENQTGKLKIKEYRTLGRTGFKASDIGFGAGNLSNPAVLDAALEAGINYIDTAEHYARGNSERTVGEVLKKHDRKKIFVTTKLNFGFGGSAKVTLKKRFLKCLERLQMEYVDCLMIHMTPTINQVKHEPYHELIRELKAEGKVRFSGLSNHGIQHNLAGPIKDGMEKVILAAADCGRFDVALFTYNFIQKKQGEIILKACKEKNMGTTIMKTDPVKFNSSLQNSLKEAAEKGRKLSDKLLKMAAEYKTFASKAEEFKEKYGLSSKEQVRDAALRFVLGNPDVHSACPTLNSFDDLNAYLPLSGTRLKPVETKMLTDYTSVFGKYYCRHACSECESKCPHEVPVNSIMRYNHYFHAQGREKYALEHYASLPGSNAASCVNCDGLCEAACPHNVPIQSLLIMAHQTLSLP